MAIRADDIDLQADRVLVERYQGGDGSAFGELYRRHVDRLRAFCLRRVGDPHDAEEIVQEAFVRALQALPRLDGERRFYPWMTVIASRLCVDHHRRRGRVQPRGEIDPGVVDGDHHARLAWEVDLSHLDVALGRLRDRHREVLHLREGRGLTYAEIADRLAVPQTTVETLLFRARQALRREFAAVAGDGRLAGVPLLGWVSRRLGRLRTRIGDHLPELASLTGPVAAGAVVATLALAPGGLGSRTGPTVPARVATTGTAPVTGAAVEPGPAGPDAAAAPAATGTDPHLHPDGGAGADRRPLPDGSTVGTPRFGVEGEDGPGVERAADDMPIAADAGPLTIGVDPDAPGAWLDETLDHLGGRP